MNRSTMQGRYPGVVAGPVSRISPALLAAAFAVFVFVVTTFRAAIDPDVPVDIFSDKRIVATLIGGVVYWLTLRAIALRIDAPIGEIVRSALKVLVLGSAALLATRAAMDLADSVSFDVSIARNIRWLLLWLGYFASWVAGFVAHAFYLKLKAPPAAALPQTGHSDEVLHAGLDTYECADPLHVARRTTRTGR